jgi:hypothetical protein
MTPFKQLQKSTFILLALITLGCADANSQNNRKATPVSQEWKDYWYSGKAELTRYALSQSRYGEIREGDAVLIFVTEDFLKDKQVKHDRGPKTNTHSVLKLNFTKKFWTGIYPYSLITSAFSPVDGQPTVKVSTSAQEWCGHSYSQINFRKNKYNGVLHSYFQSRGDQEFSLKQALLEDEVWSMIRMRPGDLPIGKIDIVPGTQFIQLRHHDFAIEKATASLSRTSDASLSDKPLSVYTIQYEGFERTLAITYETAFPHTIVAWEEKGARGQTTRAVRTHAVKSPYWGQNSLADSVMRKKLGLY